MAGKFERGESETQESTRTRDSVDVFESVECSHPYKPKAVPQLSSTIRNLR